MSEASTDIKVRPCTKRQHEALTIAAFAIYGLTIGTK